MGAGGLEGEDFGQSLHSAALVQPWPSFVIAGSLDTLATDSIMAHTAPQIVLSLEPESSRLSGLNVSHKRAG